jgi:hypothetical protein
MHQAHDGFLGQLVWYEILQTPAEKQSQREQLFDILLASPTVSIQYDYLVQMAEKVGIPLSLIQQDFVTYTKKQKNRRWPSLPKNDRPSIPLASMLISATLFAGQIDEWLAWLLTEIIQIINLGQEWTDERVLRRETNAPESSSWSREFLITTFVRLFQQYVRQFPLSADQQKQIQPLMNRLRLV